MELQRPALTRQSSTAALPYRETVGNEKLEDFNGAPKYSFYDSLSEYWSSASAVTRFSVLYQVYHKYECKQATAH